MRRSFLLLTFAVCLAGCKSADRQAVQAPAVSPLHPPGATSSGYAPGAPSAPPIGMPGSHTAAATGSPGGPPIGMPGAH